MKITILAALFFAYSSHAGMVVQQNNLEQRGFYNNQVAAAAMLNLGSGKFCIVSTVGKPHLLPQELEAAEEEDLASNQQAQETVNSMMAEYPACTQIEEARIERLATEETVTTKINIPTFNIANPLGIFKTIIFQNNKSSRKSKNSGNYYNKASTFLWSSLAGCGTGILAGSFAAVAIYDLKMPGLAVFPNVLLGPTTAISAGAIAGVATNVASARITGGIGATVGFLACEGLSYIIVPKFLGY